MRFVIVTGLSGAGKSQVVKHLEDLGFFCVDNLPPSLIPKFAEVCFQSRSKIDKIALVIDIRGGELFKDIFPGLSEIKASGFNCEILFLEASDDVLIKRFKESRRNHPLSPEGRLNRAISEERKILQEIKKNANHIIDTSNLTTRQLKEEIARIFVEGKHFEGLIISIISFGFKYGLPMDCDLAFDVRFIPNPYYISSLKKLTGKHEDVKSYVLKSKETQVFIAKLSDMLEFLIPNYIKEGKSQLVIGIGCTGGKHRSVAIADDIYNILVEKQHRVVIEHRDIDKDNKALAK
jgi:UPF0042 nucleotide-binding protein